MRVFLMVFVCVVVTFTVVGVAQADLFVRKGGQKEAVQGEKKSWSGIFLRPFKGKAKQGSAGQSSVRTQAAVDYNKQYREILQQRQELADAFKALSYWTESGRKPKGLKEIASYAQAHRAPMRAKMLEARAARMAPIRARKKAQLAAYKESVVMNARNPDAVIAFNIAHLEAQRAAGAAVRVYQSQQSTQKPRQVYRKPVAQSPSRVIRDYR
ncbi:MAG: hypothetical protein ACRBCT_00160 [Alphaproteobacteria bacterium]